MWLELRELVKLIPAERLLTYHVILSRGDNQSVVPMDHWHTIRPKAGSHLVLVPRVEGPAVLAPILSAAVSAALSSAGEDADSGTLIRLGLKELSS